MSVDGEVHKPTPCDFLADMEGEDSDFLNNNKKKIYTYMWILHEIYMHGLWLTGCYN